METKHTKEYAEKMYLKQLDEFKEVGFTDGYMKAIEETNVKELLDALKLAQQLIEKHLPNELTVHDIINNAIKKAQ